MTLIQSLRSRWNQQNADRWMFCALGIFAAVALTALVVREFLADPVRASLVAAPFVFVFGAAIVGGLRKRSPSETGRVRIPERKLSQ